MVDRPLGLPDLLVYNNRHKTGFQSHTESKIGCKIW